jgi:hypothetical protein
MVWILVYLATKYSLSGADVRAAAELGGGL